MSTTLCVENLLNYPPIIINQLSTVSQISEMNTLLKTGQVIRSKLDFTVKELSDKFNKLLNNLGSYEVSDEQILEDIHLFESFQSDLGIIINSINEIIKGYKNIQLKRSTNFITLYHIRDKWQSLKKQFEYLSYLTEEVIESLSLSLAPELKIALNNIEVGNIELIKAG